MEGFKMINEYKPKANLVVYESQEGNIYCEIHKVNEKGKMLSGKPVSVSFMKEIFKQTNSDLTDHMSFDSIVPSNVMWYDSQMGVHKIIWYTEPMKKMLRFQSNMNIPNGKAFIPGMIWMYDGESLLVFAYKGNKPKQTKSNIELFNAPFFNVYNGGDICWGNTDIDKEFSSFEDIMEFYEEAFFNSEFSSHQHNKSSVDISAYWRTAIEQKLKFDYSILYESEYRFNQIFSKVRRED